MDLIAHGALRVAKVVWQPRPDSFAFTVVCKATFELRPDLSPLADAQEPVVEADVYSADGASLARASELLPLKKRPEVLVTGHAYAPEARPVTSLVARLVMNEINKSIHIVGDCHITRDGRIGEPTPFTRMPLSWERAAGGPGTANPAGRPPGDAAPADPSGLVLLPNLFPPGLQLPARSTVIPPVNLGPTAPLWPTRAACLQRHVAWWEPDRWHEQPLPDDIDLGYFNTALPDQQRATPFGDEPLYLEHLHPRFPRLSTRLAGVSPTATVDLGEGPRPLQLRCDTLVIDTDRGLAMLVWRAHVVLDHPAQPGRVVVTGPGSPTAAASPGVPSPVVPSAALPSTTARHAQVEEEPEEEMTLKPAPLVSSSPALPFARVAAPGPGAPPPLPSAVVTPVSATAPASASASASVGTPVLASTPASVPVPNRLATLPVASPAIVVTGLPDAEQAIDTTMAPSLVASPTVLPFGPATSESLLRSATVAMEYPAAQPPRARPRGDEDEAIVQTLAPSFGAASKELPFATPRGESVASRPGLPITESASTGTLVPPSLDDERNEPPTARRPFFPPSEKRVAQGVPWMMQDDAPRAEARRSGALTDAPAALRPPSFVPLTTEPPREAVPPPLLGPLASPAQVSCAAADAQQLAAATPGASPRPANGAEDEVVSAAPRPEIAVGAYPPARCGEIAARVACDEGNAQAILRAEDLDPSSWQRVHAHWLDRIGEEASRSRKRMLLDYDGGYVSALEAARGTLALEVYARLAEAAERGAITSTLAAHGLPAGAWPHIHRSWIERQIKDVRLGKQVRAAIDELRNAPGKLPSSAHPAGAGALP